MASGGSTVPLDSPEEKREGNLGFTCVTDTTSPGTVISADHNKDTLETTAVKTSCKEQEGSLGQQNPHNSLESAEQDEEEEEGVAVCQFFLMGKCHFGHRCRLSHSNPSSEAVLPDQDEVKDGEKAGKHRKRKGKANKATKPKDTERKEVNKKPRMRTADDVISRVLWDPSADASEFVVGYVDRFLGVLERPFSDFNWDADPCDCDYTSELALPRHRIQYFTYRGHRIWDRNSRTDRVFGSTGQSLAPPFGGEEEVEGERTQDTEQRNTPNKDPLETTEDQLPVVSGQVESETAESAHPEKEKQNEMTVTPESTCPAPDDTGSTSQGQQEAAGESSPLAEEATDGLQTLTDQISLCEREGEKGEEEETGVWKDGWEGFVVQNTQDHPDQCPPAPQEQGEENRGGPPSKRRPTHFITFRANTPAVLSCFQRLQEEVISSLPASAPHWVASSTLHVTLCLLKLPGPAEVAAAAEILRRFARLDRNPPVAVSFPLRLKHFNGKVLHLSPQPQLPLQQLNSGLQEAYREEGWLHRGSFNPRYHLTLAKVEDKEGDRIFEDVGYLRVGKGLNFGRLPVNTLHLCAMGMSKTDGFYETLCTVTLR